MKTSYEVQCITTNEVFKSAAEAANKYNISSASILCNCSGKSKSAGRLGDTKLVWEYINRPEKSNIDVNKYTMMLIYINDEPALAKFFTNSLKEQYAFNVAINQNMKILEASKTSNITYKIITTDISSEQDAREMKNAYKALYYKTMKKYMRYS